MSGTVADVNIGEYLARRVDSRVRDGYAHSREELVKKAIVHYLEDLGLGKRRAELFREASHLLILCAVPGRSQYRQIGHWKCLHP